MAIWKQANGSALTTEREVRVYNVETEEEGYVAVSWDNRHHFAKFYGRACCRLHGSARYRRQATV